MFLIVAFTPASFKLTVNVSLSVVELSIIVSVAFNVPTVPVTVSSPVVSANVSVPVVNVPVPLI